MSYQDHTIGNSPAHQQSENASTTTTVYPENHELFSNTKPLVNLTWNDIFQDEANVFIMPTITALLFFSFLNILVAVFPQFVAKLGSGMLSFESTIFSGIQVFSKLYVSGKSMLRRRTGGFILDSLFPIVILYAIFMMVILTVSELDSAYFTTGVWLMYLFYFVEYFRLQCIVEANFMNDKTSAEALILPTKFVNPRADVLRKINTAVWAMAMIGTILARSRQGHIYVWSQFLAVNPPMRGFFAFILAVYQMYVGATRRVVFEKSSRKSTFDNSNINLNYNTANNVPTKKIVILRTRVFHALIGVFGVFTAGIPGFNNTSLGFGVNKCEAEHIGYTQPFISGKNNEDIPLPSMRVCEHGFCTEGNMAFFYPETWAGIDLSVSTNKTAGSFVDWDAVRNTIQSGNSNANRKNSKNEVKNQYGSVFAWLLSSIFGLNTLVNPVAFVHWSHQYCAMCAFLLGSTLIGIRCYELNRGLKKEKIRVKQSDRRSLDNQYLLALSNPFFLIMLAVVFADILSTNCGYSSPAEIVFQLGANAICENGWSSYEAHLWYFTLQLTITMGLMVLYPFVDTLGEQHSERVLDQSAENPIKNNSIASSKLDEVVARLISTSKLNSENINDSDNFTDSTGTTSASSEDDESPFNSKRLSVPVSVERGFGRVLFRRNAILS